MQLNRVANQLGFCVAKSISLCKFSKLIPGVAGAHSVHVYICHVLPLLQLQSFTCVQPNILDLLRILNITLVLNCTNSIILHLVQQIVHFSTCQFYY